MEMALRSELASIIMRIYIHAVSKKERGIVRLPTPD
jgi:hypothetical protein